MCFFNHVWEIIREDKVETIGAYQPKPIAASIVYTLQCTKCGNLKKKEVEL